MLTIKIPDVDGKVFRMPNHPKCDHLMGDCACGNNHKYEDWSESDINSILDAIIAARKNHDVATTK